MDRPDASLNIAQPLQLPVDLYDNIVIGGGVIGLFLALELRQSGASVLLLERGEIGGEASNAAGGMLAWTDPNLDPQLRPLAQESAQLYIDLAARFQRDTGIDIDFRSNGTPSADGLEWCPAHHDERAIGEGVRPARVTHPLWP